MTTRELVKRRAL